VAEESVEPGNPTASGEGHLSSSFTSTIIKTDPLASSTVAYPDNALSSIARNSSMPTTRKRRVDDDEKEEALSFLPTSSLDYHYFQTLPFSSSTGSLPCCKGFYALGCVTSQSSERQDNWSFRFRSSQSEKVRSKGSKKYSCFVDVTPLGEMTPYSAQDDLLNAQPNPYLHNTKLEGATADLCVSANTDEVVDHGFASSHSNDGQQNHSKPACRNRFSHSNRTRPEDSTSTTSTPQQMDVGHDGGEMSPGDDKNIASNRSILSIPPLITECHYNMEEAVCTKQAQGHTSSTEVIILMCPFARARNSG